MAKFRFRLATLRKLREARRDELRMKLAEAYQAVQLLEEQLAAVQREIIQLQATQRSAIEGATTDVNWLLEAGRYQSALRAQQTTMQDQTKLLFTEIERRRQAVVDADQQVRVLDKLHERQLNEHRQKLQRAEVKLMDEIASRHGEIGFKWAQ